MEVTRVYKPEINACPICGSRLKYRYTVSNKVITFSGGRTYRVKNLGYACSNPECSHPNIIYTSQTANKFCVKGYTYSAKILATILYYKINHKSREEICDILSLDGVLMSDRNVDIIYEKLYPNLTMDYKKNIRIEYDYMMNEFGQIMLSIDSIDLPDKHRFISIRNSFSSRQIGCHIISGNDYSVLDDYLNKDLNITMIATVRPSGYTYNEVKKRVSDKTKIISFIKY